MTTKRNKATTLEWLRYFYFNVDLGPADEDVRRAIRESFMEDTGKDMPEGWGGEE